MGLSCITWALGKWRERQSKAKLSELGRSFRWRMNLGKGRALSLAGLSIALVSQLWWTLSASRGTVIARIRSFYYVLDRRNVNAYVLWLCFVEKRRGVCVEWPVVVFPASHWQPWRSSIFSALCWALLILSLPLSLHSNSHRWITIIFLFEYYSDCYFNLNPGLLDIFFNCYGQSSKSDILSDVNVLLQSSSCQCNRYVYIVSFLLSNLFAFIVMF